MSLIVGRSDPGEMKNLKPGWEEYIRLNYSQISKYA